MARTSSTTRAEVVAAGVGVAGVEAEADVVAAGRRPMASQSRAIASSRRAIALSPPAVFSMSSGTGSSSPSMHLRQLSKPFAASSSTPRWPPCTMTPLAPISAGGRQVLLEQLAAGDADAVVEAGDVDRVGRVDVEVDARRLGVGLERRGPAGIPHDGALVALRVAEEELRERGPARRRLRDRVLLVDVRTDV